MRNNEVNRLFKVFDRFTLKHAYLLEQIEITANRIVYTYRPANDFSKKYLEITVYPNHNESEPIKISVSINERKLDITEYLTIDGWFDKKGYKKAIDPVILKFDFLINNDQSIELISEDIGLKDFKDCKKYLEIMDADYTGIDG